MTHALILPGTAQSGKDNRMMRQVIMRCLKYLSTSIIPHTTKGDSLTILLLRINTPQHTWTESAGVAV